MSPAGVPDPSRTDDLVATFSMDGAPVRGRVVRIAAAALDPILRRHEYPRPVAMLLGEALSLAALVGSLLKVDGKLTVQAQGSGPVTLLVAEHNAGALRGYARLTHGAAIAEQHRLPPKTLLGEGHLVLTLDRGGDAPAYQGMVALEGDTLAECAEAYFLTSEQTETSIALAVGEAHERDGATWRAGGLLMQKVAADQARGDPAEDWNRASILFATVRDDELIDPDLPADRLLYRLFHEERVRMAEPQALVERCTCDEERLVGVMKQFPPDELRELVEPDGLLHAKCQFCARKYLIAPTRVGVAL
jgi:molecular chaperone Hsp33